MDAARVARVLKLVVLMMVRNARVARMRKMPTIARERRKARVARVRKAAKNARERRKANEKVKAEEEANKTRCAVEIREMGYRELQRSMEEKRDKAEWEADMDRGGGGRRIVPSKRELEWEWEKARRQKYHRKNEAEQRECNRKEFRNLMLAEHMGLRQKSSSTDPVPNLSNKIRL